MPLIRIVVCRMLYALVLCTTCFIAHAQSILNRNMYVSINRQKLGYVLAQMEEKGNFRFSYNSNIVPRDSVVTVQAENKTIKQTLDQLLNRRFEYRETQNFVILRYAPLRLSVVTDKVATEGEDYTISGYIVDDQTGKKLENASVYEKNRLQSTLTDANGYFNLKLDAAYGPINLTVSKENYRDTTMMFLADVKVEKRKRTKVGYIIEDMELESSDVGQFFLSAKQRIQALNIGGYITQVPFQASLTPGLSSHGSFSGQVVNKFSLNAVGGYNAGVDGVEVGGIFNLDRSNVRYVQVAGIFNVVGGNVEGVQVGGIFNAVYKNVDGVQVGGLLNAVKGGSDGVQVAGLLNQVKQNAKGVQVAGLGNIASRNFNGVQVAGLSNITSHKVDGVQIAGLFNYARTLRGMQIGLVNMADSSSGVSIGLLNIVWNGYHKLSGTINELRTINGSIKTGTESLYTIWTAGKELESDKKIRMLGFGFGNQLNLNNWLKVNSEATSRWVYQGNLDRTSLLNRLDLGITLQLTSFLSVNGGPAINFLYSDQRDQVSGYTFIRNRDRFKFNHPNWSGWVGWSAGITIF